MLPAAAGAYKRAAALCAGEVMLGDRLARTLGRSVGDRVRFRDPDGRAVTLAVVGVGTGPDLTDGQFGGGVVMTTDDAEQLQRTQPARGALVTYTPGTDADRVSRRLGAEMEITTPERPPDVDNLAQLGRLLGRERAVGGVPNLAGPVDDDEVRHAVNQAEGRLHHPRRRTARRGRQRRRVSHGRGGAQRHSRHHR